MLDPNKKYIVREYVVVGGNEVLVDTTNYHNSLIFNPLPNGETELKVGRNVGVGPLTEEILIYDISEGELPLSGFNWMRHENKGEIQNRRGVAFDALMNLKKIPSNVTTPVENTGSVPTTVKSKTWYEDGKTHFTTVGFYTGTPYDHSVGNYVANLFDAYGFKVTAVTMIPYQESEFGWSYIDVTGYVK